MYAIVVLVLLAVVVAEEKYPTKFDNVDVDQILSNDRLLDTYVKCLLDQGKCTTDGLELKKHMPDALETECSKCSDKQREMATKIIKFLSEKKKEIFSELEAKYDPNGKYKEKYKKKAEAEGIKI